MGSIDHLDNGRLNGKGLSNGASDTNMDFEVLIIGGGFSGCYALHHLRKQGFSAHIVEAGSALGGVWHWNSYPGARVDSEAPYYQLSVREAWKDWTWTERFPGHEELKSYFRHIDKALDISKDVSYNTVVVGADFDTETARWIVKTNTGRTITSRFLIPATGSSMKRYEPHFPGKESFRGTVVHSAAWPKSGIDFRNKRVAIIGAGATGVQCVQEIAKQPGVELTVYVRNINIAVPMQQRAMSELEQRTLKAIYGHLFTAAREINPGIPYDYNPKSTAETTPEEREALWEELWQRGGFNFQTGQYTDFLLDEESNHLIYDFWAKKTRARIRNPEKRAILVPDKQPFPISTKRSSLEQDYYECLDQDNVEIVDVKKTRIRDWTARGIMTENGREREHDIIVLATGYDSMTGALTSMGLRGKDGVDLKERWKDGVWTYLGLMARGCPNMFMIYGPQVFTRSLQKTGVASTALTNAPPFIEQQIEIIADFLAKLRKEKSAEEHWKKTILAIHEATLFRICDSSWYIGANIPGKKKEQLVYVGGVPQYIQSCREGMSDWENFDAVKDEGPEKDSDATSVLLKNEITI
ncbi:baeyer-Villiger monooxygenase [Colletotrichum spaethianum]|uniref:Baeyer-Villiger monooxygenase n=1 Tax=Colletotrichum spaethianum TaxID=700344 RepID=A0AA37LEG8_9PEZI|nr:baeyer-Villiger monooxygenase [Colletotrichum spaethianum]GKT44500.1 baeyer-Villiger monooxygenase [Colletotrichum spaethianum]